MWNKIIDDWKTPVEYIDREAANLALAEQGFDWDKAKQALASVPAADVVPVVYCKDCKYADTERRNATEKRYFNSILFCRNSNLCGDEPLAMWPDDFCSYGERKDGGAE